MKAAQPQNGCSGIASQALSEGVQRRNVGEGASLFVPRFLLMPGNKVCFPLLRWMLGGTPKESMGYMQPRLYISLIYCLWGSYTSKTWWEYPFPADIHRCTDPDSRNPSCHTDLYSQTFLQPWTCRNLLFKTTYAVTIIKPCGSEFHR